MERKTISFDLSEDRLARLADKKFEEGDYLAGLRYLHKQIELYGAGPDEYAALADAYDDLELYELSADQWFLFLDVCDEDERVEAYEGLYNCYFHLGNEALEGYYYGLLRLERERLGDFGDDTEGMEYYPDGEGPDAEPASDPRPRLRLVWPPEKADCTEEIGEGLAALRRGAYEEAAERLSAVPPAAPQSVAARNYLAVAYLLGGKPDEAEKVCASVLEEDEENVQALCTYAALLTEQDRREESRAVAERLARIHTEDPDELYKVATVCCENGLYRKGYEDFCLLEKHAGYDTTLLYFKAVAALRCGETRECVAALGKLLDLKPGAAVARYAYREAKRYMEEGGAAPEIDFFYRVPASERVRRMHLLAMLAQIPREALAAYCRETDVTELLEWCMDEGTGREGELQLLGLLVAVRAGLEPFWRGAFLNTGVGEAAKLQALCELCGQNKPFELGLCVAGVYRDIAFDRLRTGRVRHMSFVRAYAKCVARFVPLGFGSADDYRRSAQKLYAALEAAGQLASAKEEDSLACAIYLAARPRGKKSREAVRMFGAKPAAVAQFLRVLRGEGALQREAAAADAAAAETQGNEERNDPGGSDETH